MLRNQYRFYQGIKTTTLLFPKKPLALNLIIIPDNQLLKKDIFKVYYSILVKFIISIDSEDTMKTSFYSKILILILVFIFNACSSFRTGEITIPEKSRHSNPKRIHVNAEIWGVYMFKKVPIWSGSHIKTGKTRMFKTTALIRNAMEIIQREAKKMGAKNIINVTSRYTSEWIPYSLMFWYREVQISATFEM